MPSAAPSWRLAVVGGLVALTALIAAAVVDLSAPQGGLGAALVDIGVGVVFVATALSAAGPWRQRLLVSGVGVAWLAGSALPMARSWHQGGLVLAVALFPTGRLRSRRDAIPVALALVVASGTLTQAGGAACFVLHGAPRRHRSTDGTVRARLADAGCRSQLRRSSVGRGWWAVSPRASRRPRSYWRCTRAPSSWSRSCSPRPPDRRAEPTSGSRTGWWVRGS